LTEKKFGPNFFFDRNKILTSLSFRVTYFSPRRG
jgi:hypothetical protein